MQLGYCIILNLLNISTINSQFQLHQWKIAKLIKFYGKKLYCENLVGNGIENITASSQSYF